MRAAVTAFQAAIKDKDAARVWGLLDAKSQTEADQAAVSVRGKYAAADAAGKADLENVYGMSGKDLEKLDGPGFVRTRRFLGQLRRPAGLQDHPGERDRQEGNGLLHQTGRKQGQVRPGSTGWEVEDAIDDANQQMKHDRKPRSSEAAP